MIKGTIQQEDTTLINIYIPNKGAPKYGKQILTDIKGEIDRNTDVVRGFNTPLISVDRSSREKINKEIVALNEALDQINLIDIFRACHSKAAECTYHILP